MSDPEKKILFVTYEPALGRVVSRALGKESDFPSVEVVKDLDEAQAALQKKLTSVVITDWTRVNGEEVVKASLENDVRGVIVINGGGQDVADKVEHLGAENLDKPFEFDQLIAAVRLALAK